MDRDLTKGILGLLIVVLISVFLAFDYVIPQFFNNTYTGVVTDKVVKRIYGSDTYLIYIDEEKGKERVLMNGDNLFKWKWGSSDIYGKLKVGKKYTFHVYGYRIPFLSFYENIVNAELYERK